MPPPSSPSTTQPAGVTGGSPFALDVAVQDQFGNTITTDNTTGVSLAIVAGTGTPGAALSGTIPVTVAAGIASFTDLSVDSAGTSYEIEATDTGLSPDTTAAFDVSAGAPTQLAFVDQPTNTLAGATIAPAITVAIRDAVGNTVTTATDSVDVAIANNPRAARCRARPRSRPRAASPRSRI